MDSSEYSYHAPLLEDERGMTLVVETHAAIRARAFNILTFGYL